MIAWHYPEIPASTPGGGNNVKSLFGGKQSVEAPIFVREDLQNRVDARPEGSSEPVVVKYTFRTLSRECVEKYFPADFVDHVIDAELSRTEDSQKEQRKTELEELFDAVEVPVLIIEDYNTTGLNGPLNSKFLKEWPNETPAQNGMTCFFHRSGVSGKTGEKLGSAGLGRHVYYMASSVSTKFVITRPDLICKSVAGAEGAEEFVSLEPAALFFGQSCQNSKEERIDDRDVVFDNYLSMSPGFAGGETHTALLPYGVGERFGLPDDAAVVTQAAEDFQIDRNTDSECGTSIIIPFPRKNINIQTLTKAIAGHFAYPVLSGLLQVELHDETSGGSPLLVRFRRDLPDLIEAPESILSRIPEQILQRNRFLVACCEALTSNYSLNIPLSHLGTYDALEKSLFTSEEHIKELQEKYDVGQLIRIDLAIEYQGDQHGQVKVFMRKNGETDPNGKVTVARGGLEITDYSDSRFSNSYNALVQVQPDGLGTLLRKSETPSHDRWVARDIESECPEAENLIRLITRSAAKLRDLFNAVVSEEDRSAFSDLLPGGTKTTLHESPFHIYLIDDGAVAKVKKRGGYAKPLKGNWKLELIYDANGMGRKAAHRPGSIVLPKDMITTKNCELLACDGNKLEIEIQNDTDFEWRIPANDFPTWADLYFRVMNSSAEGGE